MTAERSQQADICVIGGGPSGSTVAHRLASFGYDVCLLERDPLPRPRIAASLPSSILPLLDAIGARDRVEAAGFLRPERIVVWWSEEVPTSRTLPGPSGFHVDRGEFDRLLLENAAANGVRVLQPAAATRVERRSGGGWKIQLRHREASKEIAARLVVDASGGRTLLPGRRHRVSPPLMALYAPWRGVGHGGTEGRVEAGENEWYWCAPIGGGRSIAAVFLDPKRVSARHGAGVETVYRRLLGGFRLFRGGRSGRLDGRVAACDASSRRAEDPVGPDFVRVGDACLSLDPLSSQGIQTAIASGLQGAIVVNTLARHPANADAAIAFYRERQTEKARQFAAKTASFYGERAAICDTPFWRDRARHASDAQPFDPRRERLDGACRLALAAGLEIESLPTIRGDVIAPAPTVRHETMARPVAFVGGIEVVPLLGQIRPGRTAREIVDTWSERVPVELGWSIMRWLWEHRIVVAASEWPGDEHGTHAQDARLPGAERA